LGNEHGFGQFLHTITVKAYVMDVKLEKSL
jgi:hypothetical protein